MQRRYCSRSPSSVSAAVALAAAELAAFERATEYADVADSELPNVANSTPAPRRYHRASPSAPRPTSPPIAERRAATNPRPQLAAAHRDEVCWKSDAMPIHIVLAPWLVGEIRPWPPVWSPPRSRAEATSTDATAHRAKRARGFNLGHSCTDTIVAATPNTNARPPTKRAFCISYPQYRYRFSRRSGRRDAIGVNDDSMTTTNDDAPRFASQNFGLDQCDERRDGAQHAPLRS
jgi:hypothetical protein